MGRSPVVEIIGEDGPHQYSFKRLKRRDAHEARFLIAVKFARVVDSLKGSLLSGVIDLKKLEKGDFEISDILKLDVAVLIDVVERMGFDAIWALAKKLLDGVEIDGVVHEDLDECDYYNERTAELVKAAMVAGAILRPFSGVSLSAGSGSNASPTTNP
jgi:hypothetical protein